MTDPAQELQIPDSHRRIIRFLDKCIFGFLIMFLGCSAFSIALSEIGYFSALALWLCRMVYARGMSFPATPLDWFFIAYVAAEFLAMIFSVNSLYALRYFQKRVLLLPIAYILLANATTAQQLKILAGAILGSALAVALWSFSDLVLHFPEYIHGQRRLGEFQIYMTAGGIMMIALLLLVPFIVHLRYAPGQSNCRPWR